MFSSTKSFAFFCCLAVALSVPALCGTGSIGNFTLVDGVVANGAGGSIVISPPEDVANLEDVSFFVLNLENQKGLSSVQIVHNGGIIVELLPSNDNIHNEDYTGIITYSTSEDPNPLSPVEETDIGGVTVEQYKEPGITFAGSASKSSSFNPSGFLGEFAGKTQEDFEAALKAGELDVVVRTYAYPDGEMTATLKAVETPTPDSGAKDVVTFAGAAAFVASLVLN